MQLWHRGSGSGVKTEAGGEGLLQPLWQPGGHLGRVLLGHVRHHQLEALVGQLAISEVQDSHCKAPHVCVTAPQAKFTMHLLWSPGCTQPRYRLLTLVNSPTDTGHADSTSCQECLWAR